MRVESPMLEFDVNDDCWSYDYWHDWLCDDHLRTVVDLPDPEKIKGLWVVISDKPMKNAVKFELDYSPYSGW